MRIEGVIWLDQVVDKLASKHSVAPYEVEEVFLNKPRFRFAERGRRSDENVYLALGQTNGGRHLAVFFIYKQTNEALILNARDMAYKERKIYGRK